MEPREAFRMNLSPEELQEAQRAKSAAQDEFLAPENLRTNVVGLAVGPNIVGGEATGEPAVIVLVSQKVPEEYLIQRDRVPIELGGVQTDVMDVGPVTIESLRTRARPAQGGYSVGHIRITAGTIGTCVYDILPGGPIGPDVPGGIGIPQRYYILSNNHVLANSNAAAPGDPVLQPGPLDGGRDPQDRIARLSRFVPLTLDPPTPITQHRNLVDAAIAEGEFHDLNREIYWSGYVRGWRQRTNVGTGLLVKKTGRTTSFTTGRIQAINATIDVNYRDRGVARFVDQIVTTNMSDGGDSGSLVTTLDNVAVGLLFAGSDRATIVNHFEHIRSLLRVEVAEATL